MLLGTVWFFNNIFYPNQFIDKYLDELLNKIPIKLNRVLRSIIIIILVLSIFYGLVLLPALGNCI